MTTPLRSSLSFATILLVCWASSQAATYHVSPRGDDSAKGDSWEAPWKTLNASIPKLKSGDTLIVGDGNYFEETVYLREAAEAGENIVQPITIRAEHPGMAVLYGDRELGTFQKTKGYEYVYETPCAGPVQAVMDSDSDCVFECVGNLMDLERMLAGYYYDEASKKLYVHSVTGNDPNLNALRTVELNNGIMMIAAAQEPRRSFVIDGLTIKGFRGIGTRLDNAKDITIQNCNFYHNTYGIHSLGVKRGRYLKNYIFSNNLPRAGSPEQAAILIAGPCGDILVEGNLVAYNRANNIRTYGASVDPGGNITYSKNLSIGGAPSWFKPLPDEAFMRNNVVEGAAGAGHFRDNTVGEIQTPYVKESEIPYDLVYGNKKEEARFADPIRYDYRLQSDSPYRGKKPGGGDLGAFPYQGNVYFVKPDGSDTAEGTAVSVAWKTFSKAASTAKAGDTVYLLAGTYEAGISPASDGKEESPIQFRARGEDRVVIDGNNAAAYGFDLKGKSHFHIEGVEIIRCKKAAINLENAKDIEVKQCLLHNNHGAGIRVHDAAEIRLRDNVIVDNAGSGLSLERLAGIVEAINNILQGGREAAIRGDESAVKLYRGNYNCLWGRTLGNLAGKPIATLEEYRKAWNEGEGSVSVNPGFANPQKRDYRLAIGSLCRGRGFLEKPIGDGRVVPLIGEPQVQNVRVYHVNDTTATITFETPTTPGYAIVRYGQGDKLDKEIVSTFSREIFHVVNIVGLKPGERYQFQPGISYAKRPWLESYLKEWLQSEGEPTDQKLFGKVEPLKTSKRAPQKRTLYVRQDGDDTKTGLKSEQAWRTIAQACAQARAGDTVLVGPGTYRETLVPFNSGVSKDLPIVFRSETPRAAILDGNNFMAPSGIRLMGKQFIVIDGFTVRGHNSVDYDQRRVSPYSAQVVLSRSQNCTLTNCYIDGADTPPGTSWRGQMGLRLDACGGISVVDNCFIANTWQIWITDSPVTEEPLIVQNNTFIQTYIWAIHLTGRTQQLRLRNNLFVEHVKAKASLPYIRCWYPDNKIDSDYNCFYFFPSAIPNVAVGRVNDKRIGGSSGDFQAEGLHLEQWQKEFAQDVHSLALRLPSDNLGDFKDYSSTGKPYASKGENGAAIGCTWLGKVDFLELP